MGSIIPKWLINRLFLSKLGPKTKEDRIEVLDCCKGCEYLDPKLHYCNGEDSLFGLEKRYHESKQREKVKRLIMKGYSCRWHTNVSLMPTEFLGQQYSSK